MFSRFGTVHVCERRKAIALRGKTKSVIKRREHTVGISLHHALKHHSIEAHYIMLMSLPVCRT